MPPKRPKELRVGPDADDESDTIMAIEDATGLSTFGAGAGAELMALLEEFNGRSGPGDRPLCIFGVLP